MSVTILLFAVAGCGDGSSGPTVKISSFDPAMGTYRAGDKAVSSLRFKNTGNEEHTFWAGYSVQDGAGDWHDAPAGPVSVEQGEESEAQKRGWVVPKDSPLSGSYKVVMTVWDGNPEEDGSVRLGTVERRGAFQVIHFREDFGSLDDDLWSVTSKVDKKLGHSYLEPENVDLQGGNLRLKLPAGTQDGGEIQSEKLYKYGSYRARMKVPNAPSSITGFFLYKEPDFYNEIDIEVFNDPSGRILFTTYAGGEETNNVKKQLSFDPTASFHEYRFDFYPEQAKFYVDGKLLHSFNEGLPEDSMKLYVNAWFPTWLAGEKPQTDRYTYVDRVQH